MTIEEIKELLRIFNESGVAELELQRGENRLRIRRGGSGLELTMPVAMPAAAAAVPAAPAAPAAVAAPAPAPAPVTPPPAAEDGTLVKSPIVGTFYEAPSPGAPPFVKVGDAVEKGQVLCIIESMKLMNEIESEVAGTIVARLVENGRPVEYGEALFRVRPR
jgi:acetyl-CoA carboxylase biotin carboxyl carrier protein